MVDLIAKSAADGLLPVSQGGCTLVEEDLGPITSVMPFAGQVEAVSAALAAAHGLGFPGPNRVTRSESALCVWTGRGQGFLMGVAPDPSLGAIAALTDQSDAWVALRLEGARGADVLARLVPVDLRSSHFGEDTCARTLCQHVSVVIRRSAQGLHIMGFRSMAATLVHEIADAMAAVAARDAAG